MIENWRISGFKAISETIEINIGSGVVLCGANSSGKSSIIQTMLLMSQSSQGHESSVLLNGRLVQLGGFSEIKNDSIDSSVIKIGGTFNVSEMNHSANSSNYFYISHMVRDADETYEKISFEVSFGFFENPKDSLENLFPYLISSEIVGFRKDGLDNDFIKTKRRSANEILKGVDDLTAVEKSKYEKYFDFSVECGASIVNEIKEAHGDNSYFAGAHHVSGIPINVVIFYDEVEKKSHEFFDFICNGRILNSGIRSRRVNLGFSKDIVATVFRRLFENREVADDDKFSLFKEYIDALDSYDGDEERLLSVEGWRKITSNFSVEDRVNIQGFMDKFSHEIKSIYHSFFPNKKSVVSLRHPLIDFSYAMVGFLGGKLKYLGPLRDSPRAVYPLSNDPDPKTMGLKGEYTAAVYNQHKDLEVSYISSQSFVAGTRDLTSESLSYAVQDWLGYLGVVDGVHSQFKGKHGYEMEVKPKFSSGMHDLTHVGVGVSQVLPIVVMSLLSDTGDVFIFEQPELHLHPKVQSRLGDFFIALGLMKRQVIIETHSEYLIDKLRLRIAKEKDGKIKDSSNVYFVEIKNGATEIRKIDINEYGVVEDWPEDFFDESAMISQEIIAAASLKRRGKLKDD